MTTKCNAEVIFTDLHDLFKKISDEKLKSIKDKEKLIKLLDQYWEIECPEDNQWTPRTCLYAKPINWIEFHGYTCMADLIKRYDYEENGIIDLKNHKTIDPLKAHWACRNGHYNP